MALEKYLEYDPILLRINTTCSDGKEYIYKYSEFFHEYLIKKVFRIIFKIVILKSIQ